MPNNHNNKPSQGAVMLSKQVKQRRNINYNKRILSASKKLRANLAASIEMPSFRTLLAGRRLTNIRKHIERFVDTPVQQELLSSKHLVLEDSDQAYGLDLQARMMAAEDRRRARAGGMVVMGGKMFHVSPVLKGNG
jgi:hypothetical protein